MEEADSTYAPESPDLSGYHAFDAEPVHPQHQGYRGSISLASPYTPVDAPGQAFAPQNFAAQSYFPRQQSLPQVPEMPPRSSRVKHEDESEWLPDAKTKLEPVSPSAMDYKDNGRTAPGLAEGIEVKTKFPVARIKRIMQADEDVGKVAQVTPVVVSKALELFMISIITKSASEAKARGQKRVGAAHLKQAVMKEQQFDFLSDIVSKVPDAPAPNEQQPGGEDSGDTKRKKPPARRRKKGDDDDY